MNENHDPLWQVQGGDVGIALGGTKRKYRNMSVPYSLWRDIPKDTIMD